MRNHAFAVASIVLLNAALATAFAAQGPKTHRLEATPSTVAYGYYWSEAKPVLRIASGDVIDVDTLLTNTPTGLQRAGVPDDKIQRSLKAVVAEVTGDRKGPGGHILTGPVYVEGAEPGDVLEVKVLSIDFAIDYGYNGCSGFLPENCDPAVGQRILPIDAKRKTAEFAPGIVIPLRPFFGSMGVAPELGRVKRDDRCLCYTFDVYQQSSRREGLSSGKKGTLCSKPSPKRLSQPSRSQERRSWLGASLSVRMARARSDPTLQARPSPDISSS